MEPIARSSFYDLLARTAPDALPTRDASGAVAPHGTTIVTVTFAGGVAMAGDRRATWSSQIVQNDIEKVFAADNFTMIGVAGTAGVAVELVRLFQVELEHFEKIEGTALSFDGKANRLGGIIRSNYPAALQGLGVLPIYAGWDGERGRIVSYDVVGGRYEERDFSAVGSGAPFARGSLKKLYRGESDEKGAVTALIQALVDSSDEDSATAGPDPIRRLYPLVCVAGAFGVRMWTPEEIEALVEEILTSRRMRPNGPGAPLL